MMFQSTFQSICTIVLPKPSFKVPPSQPDPIYYTGISANRYSYNPKASYSDFNVSTSSVYGFDNRPERHTWSQGPRTPQQVRRSSQSVNSRRSLSRISPSPSHNRCHLSRRSSRNSTCCCSCSCPYDISDRNQAPEYQVSEFGLLTAVTSSLLESPSPRSPPQSTPKARRRSMHSTKPGKPRPASFPSIETPSPVTRGPGNAHIRSRSFDHSKPTTSSNVDDVSYTKPILAPHSQPFSQVDNVIESLDTFKSLRRVKRRISCGGSPSDQMAVPDSFDNQSLEAKSKISPFDFLETLKRGSPPNNFDSSGSSCSSFDASDAEGAYPSTASCSLSSPVKIPSRTPNRSSQAYSDVLFPAFALSPIIEDSGICEDVICEDVDAILACYSDSPVLGRTNAPSADNHDSFDINDADWQPEVVFESGLVDVSPADAGQSCKQTHSGSNKVEDFDPVSLRAGMRTSVVLNSTSYGDSSMAEGNDKEGAAYKDLLCPPALMLTLPTPELEGIAAFSEPAALEVGPSRLSATYIAPQTPPMSRVPLGDSTNSCSLKPEPPTPMPSLPRCTSCGFGFGFDVTGSMDALPQFGKNSIGIAGGAPCKSCQTQWQKCCKWYGKRGWVVGNAGNSPRGVEDGAPSQPQGDRLRKEKVLKRSSKRLSQMIENVFQSSSNSKPESTRQDCKRDSKRASFWGNWTGDTSDTRRRTLGAVVRATDVDQRIEQYRLRCRSSHGRGELTGQGRREADEKANIHPGRSAEKEKPIWKTATGFFSRSGVASRKGWKASDATTRRRSFLDLAGQSRR